MRHQTFICYAHKDEDSLERLLVHLKPYTRDSTIEVWSDKRIKPGGSWKKEIRSALARAQAAILLVSADFIGSDFIHEMSGWSVKIFYKIIHGFIHKVRRSVPTGGLVRILNRGFGGL